jgi:hypothetical protein
MQHKSALEELEKIRDTLNTLLTQDDESLKKALQGEQQPVGAPLPEAAGKHTRTLLGEIINNCVRISRLLRPEKVYSVTTIASMEFSGEIELGPPVIGEGEK